MHRNIFKSAQFDSIQRLFHAEPSLAAECLQHTQILQCTQFALDTVEMAHIDHVTMKIDSALLDGNSAPAHLTLIRTSQSAHYAQQRGLASAVATLKDQRLAAGDFDREIFEQEAVITAALN